MLQRNKTFHICSGLLLKSLSSKWQIRHFDRLKDQNKANAVAVSSCVFPVAYEGWDSSSMLFLGRPKICLVYFPGGMNTFGFNAKSLSSLLLFLMTIFRLKNFFHHSSTSPWIVNATLPNRKMRDFVNPNFCIHLND